MQNHGAQPPQQPDIDALSRRVAELENRLAAEHVPADKNTPES
jgi:BMFP domain-containing protein YqiC